MLLPTLEAQIEILTVFYRSKQSSAHQNVLKRLFRDSSNVDLCIFLVRNGFEPSIHQRIYEQSKLPITSGKWDYFSQIYGYGTVESFLQSGKLIQTQRTEEDLLPFSLYPLSDPLHPRWKVYEEAYGRDLVDEYKLKSQRTANDELLK